MTPAWCRAWCRATSSDATDTTRAVSAVSATLSSTQLGPARFSATPATR